MSGRSSGLLGRLLLLAASPLVFLAAFELAARVAGVTPLADDPNYRARETLDGCRWAPGDVERFCSPKAVVGRGTGGRRLVLVLGGSSVRGHPPDEKRTIPHYLQAALDAARPGAFRVRNLGVPCKDSFFVEACGRLALGASPAWIAVYSGHNDFAGYCTARPQLRMVVARHPWLLDLRHLLARTRFYSSLASSARRPLAPRSELFRLDPDFDLEASKRVVVDTYRANVEGLLDAAAARGVPVLLTTVVGNLAEHPFRREKWDVVLRRVDQDPDPPSWMSAYAEGIRRIRDGRPGEALAAFERARDGFYPDGRAAGVLNEAIRELAGRDGVGLVDFERELDTMGRREPIGCNFFGSDAYCDGVHPNPRTNRLIGDAIARAILDGEAAVSR